MLMVRIGASLLENMLAGKGVTWAGEEPKSWSGFLMLPHPLTNF